MQEHQLLEMFLFYSIPRIDTNVIAHRLIAHFGSLRKVFSASYDELVKVDGIGENTATQILLHTSIRRHNEISKYSVLERYNTVDEVGQLLTSVYIGIPREQVYMLMFNGMLELIGIEAIGFGSFQSSFVSIRSIIETALQNRAAGIVLAHNHPGGSSSPSGEDIELTSQIEYICSQLELPLLEHIIVGEDGYTPIMHGKQFNKKLREYKIR